MQFLATPTFTISFSHFWRVFGFGFSRNLGYSIKGGVIQGESVVLDVMNINRRDNLGWWRKILRENIFGGLCKFCLQVLPSMYTEVVHGKCTFEKFSETEIMVTAEIDFFAHVLRFQEGSL